jgi:hypothetical protein
MRLLLLAASLVATGAFAQPGNDIVPSDTHLAVTPSNSTELTDSNGRPYCRALYIEGAGDISITDVAGTTIVYTVPAGTLLPFRPVRVNSTGTDATGITCWR